MLRYFWYSVRKYLPVSNQTLCCDLLTLISCQSFTGCGKKKFFNYVTPLFIRKDLLCYILVCYLVLALFLPITYTVGLFSAFLSELFPLWINERGLKIGLSFPVSGITNAKCLNTDLSVSSGNAWCLNGRIMINKYQSIYSMLPFILMLKVCLLEHDQEQIFPKLS